MIHSCTKFHSIYPRGLLNVCNSSTPAAPNRSVLQKLAPEISTTLENLRLIKLVVEMTRSGLTSVLGMKTMLW